MPPKVTVVRPNISEEERQERIREFEDILSTLLKCEVKLTFEQ